ncbi:MAG: DUF4252 domain-containing protein [Terracidiphilus sp.]
MKHRIATLILTLAAAASPALAQSFPEVLPPALEKQLAARASNVTEVTMDKNMLGTASQFLNGKGADDAKTRQLIQDLDGVYVREYEFDKPGQYSPADIEQIRQHFQTDEWKPMVHVRESKSGEMTDVLVKQVNGQNRGMFVLDAEPKELSIVLILGPIRMDQLGQLGQLGALGSLGALGGVAGDVPHPAPKGGK